MQYSDAVWIESTLEYDFSEERKRQEGYQRQSAEQVVDEVTQFLSGIWQIRPFREGNTRTTAVFGILYLRFLGFVLDNQPLQGFMRAAALADQEALVAITSLR